MKEYGGLTRQGQIRRLRQMAEQALSRYQIAPVSLSLLNHAYNTTFTITGPGDGRYVLHILRPVDDGLSDAERLVRVESELWWVDRVARDLNLAVPVPVRTPEGHAAVNVSVEGMTPARVVTLFRWLDGRFVNRSLARSHLEIVGRTTAQLHDLSAHLQVPEWFERPRLDSPDAGTEQEVLQLFSKHVSLHASNVLGRVLEQVRQAEQAIGNGSESFGVIHGDIHQRNYLFSGHHIRLIDFGDCGWAHYLYDLAVTLSELANSPHYAELRAGLLAGYRQVRHLSSEHEALIHNFVLLRELQNLTWFVRFRDDPTYHARVAQIHDRVTQLERQLGRQA